MAAKNMGGVRSTWGELVLKTMILGSNLSNGIFKEDF